MAKNEQATDEGVYAISEVAERTGVPAATLRQWQRRYEFPDPERTSGGHRRYSEREVQALLTVRTWTEEGLQASAAIERYRDLSDGLPRRPEFVAERLAKALAARDAKAARRLSEHARTLLPVESEIVDVLAKTLERIGHAWQNGEASISQEHYATAFVRQRLEQLASTCPEPQDARTLVAAPSGERHELGALAATILLRRDGQAAAFVGGDLPLESLAEHATETDVEAVVLSVERDAVLDEMDDLGGLADRVAIGGAAAARNPGRVRELGAACLGEDLRALPARIEALLEGPAIPG
jgi:DNA-binding transcriptional MerR regulator/methylmalonyl-CoA mutase cobalamin-binding subunit